jgi:hypothetical protein
MENTRQLTDDNLRKDLGKNLIHWIRKVQEKRINRYNGSDNSYKNGMSTGSRYTVQLSLK